MQQSPPTGSPLPPALLRSPRRVRRRPGTLAPLLLGRILTAPALLVFAALLAFVVLEPIVAFLIPAQPAHVIEREFKPREGNAYFILYRFDRSEFIGRDEVRPDQYLSLHAGQAVKAHLVQLGPVGYSTLNRSLGSYTRHRLIVWFGATFALAIGGVFFYAMWLLPWRAYWLTKHGEATFGAVIQKSVVHGRRRHLAFTLTYQFKARGTLWARRIRICPQRYDSTGVKDLVIVLFDPSRPSRNIVYDYSDYIASS